MNRSSTVLRVIQIDPLSAAVALLAVGLAIWANVVAGKSNTISRDAAAEAHRASDAADAANEMARQERARALETHDVVWRIARDGDTLIITNGGATTARSVTAVVRVGSERFDLAPGDVGSDDSFHCDATIPYREQARSNGELIRSMQHSGIAYFPSSGLEVEARVSWQSDHGTPGIQVVTEKL